MAMARLVPVADVSFEKVEYEFSFRKMSLKFFEMDVGHVRK